MAEQPFTPLETADGSLTLVGPDGEGYKSRHGARTEARVVYLEGGGVAARLTSEGRAAVLEVGFGAGLNFLVTAEAARQAAAELRYFALEATLPHVDALSALRYGQLLAPSPLPAALIAWRGLIGPTPSPGWHRFEHGRIKLDLHVGDATAPSWDAGAAWQVDAVYHDAFSPRTLPELWSDEFLTRLSRRLLPGGRLVSFCVAGHVRRALTALGFDVQRVPGPEGGKRSVLVAALTPKEP